MDVVAHLYGGAAVRQKYQINATVANAGIPLLLAAAGEAGLDLPTTTGAADMVGINFDTAVYVTAQQTDGSSAEREVTVDIRPDTVIKAILSGGATEGTALTQHTVDTASATGLAITAGDFNTTDFDEGIIWGYSGANAGQQRKITSTSTVAATVTVAFDEDTVVGDIFLAAPFFPMCGGSDSVTLTSNLRAVDCSVATSTSAAEFSIVEVVTKDLSEEGTIRSHVLLVPKDHALNKLS